MKNHNVTFTKHSYADIRDYHNKLVAEKFPDEAQSGMVVGMLARFAPRGLIYISSDGNSIVHVTKRRPRKLVIHVPKMMLFPRILAKEYAYQIETDNKVRKWNFDRRFFHVMLSTEVGMLKTYLPWAKEHVRGGNYLNLLPFLMHPEDYPVRIMVLTNVGYDGGLSKQDDHKRWFPRKNG